MRRVLGVVLAGAILMLPAFSQSAFAQQAPQKTTYTGAAVLAAYAVNADKTADYEKVIETLTGVFSKVFGGIKSFISSNICATFTNRHHHFDFMMHIIR